MANIRLCYESAPVWYNANMVDLAQIKDYAGGELDEVVTNYEWRPVDPDGKHYGVTIKIKIYKDAANRFTALPSHRVKTPLQAGPYMPLTVEDTLEEALKGCIRGFKMFMGTVAETKWIEAEDF